MATREYPQIGALPTPRGLDQANDLLVAVGEAELAIRQLDLDFGKLIKEHQDAIAELVAQRDTATLPYAKFIQRGLSALGRWYVRNLRRHGSGRRIELASGTLLREIDSNWTVEASGNSADLVRAVRRRGLRFVTIKVELNKRAMAKEPRRLRRIPGLRIFRQDRFEAKPLLLTELAAPKENRLRRPVELIMSE